MRDGSPLKRAEERGEGAFVNRPSKGRPNRIKPRKRGFGRNAHQAAMRKVEHGSGVGVWTGSQRWLDMVGSTWLASSHCASNVPDTTDTGPAATEGASPNTVGLAVPRTVFVAWVVVLFSGIVERSTRIALLGDDGAGLLLRPFRAFALRSFTQGCASLHPGLRSCAASRLNGSEHAGSGRALAKSTVLELARMSHRLTVEARSR